VKLYCIYLLLFIIFQSSFSAQAQIPDAGSTLNELENPLPDVPVTSDSQLQIEQSEQSATTETSSIRFLLNGFRISGNSVFGETELLSLLKDLPGREVDFSDIDTAATRITDFYREHGYPVSRAFLPAQDIREGIVEITVLEGRLGQVQLDNQSRISDAHIGKYIGKLNSGDLLDGDRLERSLLLLTDIQGLILPKTILRPGINVGEADLTISVEPQRLLQGHLGFDNSGNHYTGRERMSGTLGIFSLLGRGDVITFGGVKEFPGINLGNVHFDLPISANGLNLNFGYLRLAYDLGGDFTDLNASGNANKWMSGARYPLVRSRQLNIYLTGELEQAEFEDRIAATATKNNRNYVQGTLGLSGDYRDGLFGGGVSALSIRLNAGNLDIESVDAKAIDMAAARTHGKFQFWHLDALRLQRLTESISIFMAFHAQKALGNLDSSRKFIIGGPGAVRAFASGEASGDTGYLLTGEVRRDIVISSLPGELQLAGLLDIGRIKINEDIFSDGMNTRRLSSVGMGLRWHDAGNFNISLVFAHRLGGQRSVTAAGDNKNIWVEAVKHF
jgi:hemolysin activation/secretion protein